jgi:hypothetical protein
MPTATRSRLPTRGETRAELSAKLDQEAKLPATTKQTALLTNNTIKPVSPLSHSCSGIWQPSLADGSSTNAVTANTAASSYRSAQLHSR